MRKYNDDKESLIQSVLQIARLQISGAELCSDGTLELFSPDVVQSRIKYHQDYIEREAKLILLRQYT